MKKPFDRITDTYFNQLGTSFGQKVRNRVHWVCKNATGETILNVGCSQGIISILLGREAKKVIGIDLLQESIDFANQALETEAEITKKYVEFTTANFIDVDFGNQLFDTVILGEILEHITEPKRFVGKAASLLNKDGKIIITVPFGINDFFDHQMTYYLVDLLGLVTSDLNVKEIKYFGKWVGIVLNKSQEQTDNVNLNVEMVRDLERAFYKVERKLQNEINEKAGKLAEYTSIEKKLVEKDRELTSLTSEMKYMKDNYDFQVASLKKQIEQRNADTTNLNSRIRELEQDKLYSSTLLKEKDEQLKNAIEKVELEDDSKNKNLENRLVEEKKKLVLSYKNKISTERLLLESYEKEAALLDAHKLLSKRYDALNNSKLGKLTKSYWKFRKGIKK